MNIQTRIFVACILAALPSIGMTQGLGWKKASIAELRAGVDRGDRNAQLELGIRYEEGSGVPVDRRKARKLYKAAASDSTGNDLIYASSARPGGVGRVVNVGTGVPSNGLPEAKRRLNSLKLLGL